MLTNTNSAPETEFLEKVTGAMPSARPFLEAIQEHPDPFTIDRESSGAEFAAQKPVENRPNRARMKLFTVTDGPMEGRMVVFFYKQSQVPFSRDRHSYGVCIMPSSGAAPTDINDWIFFASSGFDPAARPTGLRTAFAFTVPD